MNYSFFQLIWGYSAWLGVVYVLTIIAILLSILQQRGNPTKTFSWLIVIALIPLVGPMLYIFFGKNYRREKMLTRKEQSNQMQLATIVKTLINLDFYNWFKTIDSSQMQFHGVAQMLVAVNYTLPSRYNKVTLLNNGRQKYDALFAAIRSAKEHIHLEYYIVEDDVIGNQLRELLEQKAQQGVEVRLIYDDFGSWGLGKKYKRSLAKNGVQLFPFFKVHLLLAKNKINYRNHRKIAVIDGKIGFVGGINIGDHYLNGLPEIGIWRDTHVQLEGDAVLWLQIAFLLDWIFVSKQQLLNIKKYLPEHNIRQECVVQIATSGPDSDWANTMQTYFVAIGLAQTRLYITSPYFIPSDSLFTALTTTAMRGVDVCLLLSARSDLRIPQWASMSYVEDLLRAGVRVFLYKKGFSHSKLLMADGKFCSVGTTNMDVRSFDHNFEINALFYNEEVTQKLETEFLNDLKSSTEVTLETWSHRPSRERFMENLARILAPLL